MTGKAATGEPVQTGSPDREWLTIKEASRITGKSINALTILVNRRKVDRIRKVEGKWLIHKDSIATLSMLDRATGTTDSPTGSDSMSTLSGPTGSDSTGVIIPLEHYEKKRDEWLTERDRLQAGLMMYRYKFEEIEHKMRLLPAPPEMVARELEDKAAALVQAEKILDEAKETQKTYAEAMEKLRAKLLEEEYAKEAFRLQWEAELNRPWWKKIFNKR